MVGNGEEEDRSIINIKGHKATLGGNWVCSLFLLWQWFYRYTHVSKRIKSYALNTCRLLNITYLNNTI